MTDSKVAAILGTEDENTQVEIIQALAAPPVVITIVVTGLGGISISSVGNVSNRDVQNILLEIIRSLAHQDAKGKSWRSAKRDNLILSHFFMTNDT